MKNFELVKLANNQELLLPANVDVSQRPWDANPAHQELKGQNEVFGTDGHGSIRAEDSNSINEELNNELAERDIEQMLDPKNIIDLKSTLESKSDKLNSERKLPIDSRLDKDGSDAEKTTDIRTQLKNALVKSYIQTGRNEDNQRVVPKRVKQQIKSMLDLSFEELESRINKAEQEAKLHSNPAAAPSKTDNQPIQKVTPQDDVSKSARFIGPNDPFLLPLDDTQDLKTNDTSKQDKPGTALVHVPMTTDLVPFNSGPDWEFQQKQPKGFRAMLKKATQRAGLAYIAARNRVADVFVTENENGDRETSKRRVAAAAIGVFAVTAAGLYAANKYGLMDISGGKNTDTIADGDSTTTTPPPATITSNNVGTGRLERVLDASLVDTPTTSPELVPPQIDILAGKGFEDTFQQAFNLTDEQAARMYSELAPKLSGLPGTYIENGDVRITNPGALDLSLIHDEIEDVLKAIRIS